MSDGRKATVFVFNVEVMIVSLLSDESLMHDNNLAEGYDIFTGRVDSKNPINAKYGEVHTGDAWRPARKHYCGKKGEKMPIALIVFGDKTATDLHGDLSVTPIIFTLTFFNRAARNNPAFWRPLAYVPNLQHGKGKSDKTPSSTKVQDEHRCLDAAFKSLRDLHRHGRGLNTVTKGRSVICCVWIHFFIGDTSGFNTWLGHYNGCGNLDRPYRDCMCTYKVMDKPHPK